MIKAVIFDYTNTLYDVETDKLYPEVPLLLEKLKIYIIPFTKFDYLPSDILICIHTCPNQQKEAIFKFRMIF